MRSADVSSVHSVGVDREDIIDNLRRESISSFVEDGTTVRNYKFIKR